MPKTRAEWWKTKIDKNIERDRQNRIRLEDMGWNIIDIWECELKSNQHKSLELIEEKIKMGKAR